MITLYSYPDLFGVADNNGYGLKVFAFLRLAGVPFTHQHTSSTLPPRRAASFPISTTTAKRSATATRSSRTSRASTASPSTMG